MNIGQVFPAEYAKQLTDKVDSVTALLNTFQPPVAEVFSSPSAHYRLRAEFRIWHNGEDLYHAMFDPDTKQICRIDYFPVACQTIADFMPILAERLKHIPDLRHKLYQIDYLSGLSGELVVSLIYKRQLDESWLAAARKLTGELSPQWKVKFIGRARKQKLVVSDDFIIEQLNVGKQQLKYQQVEGSFTQPNGEVNQKMLSWACDIAKELSGDLLELYCGNGNFTLALAQYFKQVIGTEISRTSIKSAQYNIALNTINNVQVLQMSAEDVSAALEKGSSLKQLELKELTLDTILVDPPRAGLDTATEKLVSRFNDIIYISCNPQTLAENLVNLTKTHQIEKLAVFDQFPYTHHIETGVWLRKRTTNRS